MEKNPVGWVNRWNRVESGSTVAETWGSSVGFVAALWLDLICGEGAAAFYGVRHRKKWGEGLSDKDC